MSLVCLDTQILIWGVRRVASKGQESRIPLCENLLDMLQKNKGNVCITSINLAEVLAAVKDDDELKKLTAALTSRFMVFPFDALAAQHYRSLYRAHGAKVPEWIDDEHRRFSIFADMKILATALSRKVDVIYTHNVKHFTRLSEGFRIRIENLPPLPIERLSLFNLVLGIKEPPVQ